MPALSDYSNVQPTAIAHLREMGFRIWSSGDETFHAERDGWDFIADSPVALLGIVTIFERTHPDKYRDYWWRHPREVPLADLPTSAPPYSPIWATRRSTKP